MRRKAWLLALALLTPGCPRSDPAGPESPAATVGPAAPPLAPSSPAPNAEGSAPASGEPNDPRWHPLLRRIAASYTQWMRVDDRARWAPFDCRAPPPVPARLSEAADADAHGGKLYFLYAFDAAAYGAPATVFHPAATDRLDGAKQVIVKEAFRPVALAADAGKHPGGRQWRPAEKEGRQFGPGERHALFVMLELPGRPAGTDEGWIYATLAADGASVTSAGLLPSCMGCHRDAPKGRLFGLPKEAFDHRF
jgi:hypothetical protein